jgi:multidrug efflux system membrane fusion protein
MIPIVLGVGVVLAGALAGCQQGQEYGAKKAPPAFKVSHPAKDKVTDYAEYTGRLVAKDAVDVKARVTGFLKDPTKYFKEGDEVKEDQVLFEIDPRPYEAQLAQAKAQINVYDAQVELATENLKRAQALYTKTQGEGISKQDVDTYAAQKKTAEATKAAAQESLKIYQLNVDFTKVKAPITGVASRYNLTRGNLIIQDSTLLTTVVSQDPIYAYFDMDESTLLKFAQPTKEGVVQLPKNQKPIVVELKLPGETDYGLHKGTIDYVSPIINPATGTDLLRGRFDNPTVKGNVPNPTGAKHLRLMRPGMFVSVRLQVGQPYEALLVIDRAIWSNMGKKYVYVLDAKHQVQSRPIVIGPLQNNGQRVVREGLQEGDQVVVSGLPLIQLQQEVTPLLVPMPTLEGDGATVAAEQPAAGGKTNKGAK